MRDYLEHGKFKYIDKWKSKSGKWVYKYAEDVKQNARNLNDKYGPKKTITYTAGGKRPERKFGPKGPGPHASKAYTEKTVTVKKNLIGGRTVSRQEAYQDPGWAKGKEKNTTRWQRNTGKSAEDQRNKFAGNTAKRYRYVSETTKDSTGRKRTTGYLRTEYRDMENDLKRSQKFARKNYEERGNAFVRKLGALNDKYGPKVTQVQTHEYMSDGQVFVDSYVRNLIGGRTVRVESYSYDRNNRH